MNTNDPRGPSLSSPEERADDLARYAALWSQPDEAEVAEGAEVATQAPVAPSQPPVAPSQPPVAAPLDEAFLEDEAGHIAAARWEPLIELYLESLESGGGPYEPADLLRRIARVFERRLDDPKQALDALVSALHMELHDRDTARDLERLAQATGRWAEVLQSFSEFVRDEQDVERQLRLCLHLAKWYGEDHDRPELAQPYYARIVELDPNNVDALRQLARLYRKAGNHQQAGATLQHALEVVLNLVDRKEILTELGELLEQGMNDTDRALGYFKQAALVGPGAGPALSHLARIYSARGQQKELVEVFEQKVAAAREPAELLDARLEAAKLHEELGDLARAARHYRDVTDADPGHVHGLRGLARAYEALEQWAELVRVLDALVEVADTAKEKIELLLQLASVEEEKFLKSDVAAIRLEHVLEIDPQDMGAYFELERNYRKRRQWPELITTYERHVAATLERRVKIGLFGDIARVYADELGDVESAISTYRMIVALDDQNVDALVALGKLHDRKGDAAGSIEWLERAAVLAPEPSARAEALFTVGKTVEEKIGDCRAAREHYEQALDLDPSHTATLAALRRIAMEEGDYEKAARHLEAEQSQAPVSRRRAKLLVELAKLKGEQLGDHASAVKAWEEALANDPDNEECAIPLVDAYLARQEWEKAEPLLERLARKAGRVDGDRQAQHDLHQRLGRVRAALGKHEKAVKAFRAAHDVDPNDKDTLLGLADACLSAGDLAGAQAGFTAALRVLGEEEQGARAEAFYKLGCVEREQRHTKRAVSCFERALGIDGGHRPSLDALVGVYAGLGEWPTVAAYKRHILQMMVEGEGERFTLLGEIADAHSQGQKDPEAAAQALEEARAIRPDSATVLHRLLALYQSTSRWLDVSRTLLELARLEEDPARRAKLLFAIAQVHQEKLGDDEGALKASDAALDAHPARLDAFERINRILTSRKDWDGLQRAFRKMLGRLAAAESHDADLLHTLWHNLGLIYRDRLHDTVSAVEAFKMATRAKPSDPLSRHILAELLEMTNDAAGAASQYTASLKSDPLRDMTYRSLSQTALRQKDYDRAWCACAALALLGKADADERSFYEGYRRHGRLETKGGLGNEQWRDLLVHQDSDLLLGKIMELVTPAAIAAKTLELRAAGRLPVLAAHTRQDPATSPLPLAKTFGWAARVLGLPSPELHVREDLHGALATVPGTPPATVAGKAALTGLSAEQLSFIVGKHLACYRGEHYIRTLFPTVTELKILFFAAVKTVMPGFAVPEGLRPAVTATAGELAKYMQPVQREGLRLVVQRYAEEGAKADIRRWIQTTEITAARAGLLLCGDLEVAAKLLTNEPQVPDDLSPRDKVKELIVFSVSEQYASLRSRLGIAVVVEA